MGLTKKQKTTLEKIGRRKENFKIRNLHCGESTSTIDSRLTTIYNSMREHLQYLDDYYPIFERRVKSESKEMKRLLLSINRKINQSTKA